MLQILLFCTLSVCCWSYVNSLGLPGPRVYVVTPASRQKNEEGRSSPFYYHNWIRRMDSPQNATSTTTTTTQKTKTPDLIFAEFEADSKSNMKSIRKLLENERIEPSTTSTTTSRPIYVPEESDTMEYRVNYGLPVSTVSTEDGKKTDMTDYFALYNNLYGSDNHLPAPVYAPETAAPSTRSTTPPTTTSTTTTTTPAPLNVENIWHIIDNEKYNKYSGKWEEENVPEDSTVSAIGAEQHTATANEEDNEAPIDENFALPGFSTNSGNGAENESRAIRTEPNIRFPYVNLKPFQMKKPLLNALSNTNKMNNMFTSLDNFHDLKNPVRGEAQDIVSMRQPIDRYNPAQPYLPPSIYGSKSKQSSPDVFPGKAEANLVPPPPPPRPQLTADDFPTPSSYESFPPYAPMDSAAPAPVPPSPPSPAPKLSPPLYQPPVLSSDNSASFPGDNDGPPDVGYRYKPPSSSIQAFAPTIPPLTKPFKGYSYEKPSKTVDTPPPMDMDDKPYHGYHYSKPEPPSPPSKPISSYGHDDHVHHHSSYAHSHESDYPDLIYDKPHGDMDESKTDDDMKGSDMGMMPPPPPPPDMDSHGPSSDDHGFPHDFPGDFKYHHDFDDHDHDYHYHHHTTTTTTTTETPRVNRYSYYYLGKKLYYLPLYFSVYFIVYVGALIIKAVLRHKIVYPNSFRPNDQTASFFSKRSIDTWDLSKENLHEITGRVTHAISTAAEKYIKDKKKE